MKRKSKAQPLKEDYTTIIDYKNKRTGHIDYSFGTSPEETIRVTNPLAYQAANLLTEATMAELNFNVKKVQAKVILESNVLQEVKLLKLLNSEFKQGDKFSRTHITSTLQRIYNQLGILDLETGGNKASPSN